jgi:hypothetical protein
MVNDRLVDAVMEFVAANPQCTRSSVRAAVQCRQRNVDDTLDTLVQIGRINAVFGTRNTYRFEVAQ